MQCGVACYDRNSSLLLQVYREVLWKALLAILFFLIILGFSMNSPFVHEIFYFGDDHFA